MGTRFYIESRVVTEHLGRIYIESEVGVGTKASVLLPIWKA